MGLAVLGAALALGRLLSIGDMTKVNEAEFVSAVLDYAGAFVATSEGIVN